MPMKFKIISLLFVSFFLLTSVGAQQSNIGVAAEVNFPSGNSSNASAVGLGINLKAEFGLSDKFSLTANGSISNFFGRRFFGAKSPSRSYVPLKAGLKYYTDENFYLEGQVGATLPLDQNGKTGFAWSPGIGTYIKTNGSANKFDVGLRYEGWTTSSMVNSKKLSTFNFIGIRIGYVFGL